MKILDNANDQEHRAIFQARDCANALRSLRLRTLEQMVDFDPATSIDVQTKGAIKALDDLIHLMTAAPPR